MKVNLTIRIFVSIFAVLGSATSRQADVGECHVALSEHVSGLICFSYPLCGGGNRLKLRDTVLKQLKTPILFVQGTRDPLCTLDLLRKTRKELIVPNILKIVQDADHSLAVTKTRLKSLGITQEDVDLDILIAINKFVLSVIGKA